MNDRARVLWAAGLVGCALGVVALSQWLAHPGVTPPAPSFIGEWDAWESDETFAMDSNPCRLEVIAAPPPEADASGQVRIVCAAVDGRWKCWGDGRVDGATLTFRWTGPKGWRGSTCLTLDAAGDRLTGTFAHDFGQGRLYAKGKRVPP